MRFSAVLCAAVLLTACADDSEKPPAPIVADSDQVSNLTLDLDKLDGTSFDFKNISTFSELPTTSEDIINALMSEQTIEQAPCFNNQGSYSVAFTSIDNSQTAIANFNNCYLNEKSLLTGSLTLNMQLFGSDLAITKLSGAIELSTGSETLKLSNLALTANMLDLRHYMDASVKISANIEISSKNINGTALIRTPQDIEIAMGWSGVRKIIGEIELVGKGGNSRVGQYRGDGKLYFHNGRQWELATDFGIKDTSSVPRLFTPNPDETKIISDTKFAMNFVSTRDTESTSPIQHSCPQGGYYSITPKSEPTPVWVVVSPIVEPIFDVEPISSFSSPQYYQNDYSWYELDYAFFDCHFNETKLSGTMKRFTSREHYEVFNEETFEFGFKSESRSEYSGELIASNSTTELSVKPDFVWLFKNTDTTEKEDQYTARWGELLFDKKNGSEIQRLPLSLDLKFDTQSDPKSTESAFQFSGYDTLLGAQGWYEQYSYSSGDTSQDVESDFTNNELNTGVVIDSDFPNVYVNNMEKSDFQDTRETLIQVVDHTINLTSIADYSCLNKGSVKSISAQNTNQNSYNIEYNNCQISHGIFLTGSVQAQKVSNTRKLSIFDSYHLSGSLLVDNKIMPFEFSNFSTSYQINTLNDQFRYIEEYTYAPIEYIESSKKIIYTTLNENRILQVMNTFHNYQKYYFIGMDGTAAVYNPVSQEVHFKKVW